jgi:hypothetical protein
VSGRSAAGGVVGVCGGELTSCATCGEPVAETVNAGESSDEERDVKAAGKTGLNGEHSAVNSRRIRGLGYEGWSKSGPIAVRKAQSGSPADKSLERAEDGTAASPELPRGALKVAPSLKTCSTCLRRL